MSSTPGAACLLRSRKLAMSRSSVRWWYRLLNLRFLSLLAACRMRLVRVTRVAMVAIFPSLRSDGCVWSTFSMVKFLPSIDSADSASLFADFSGTTNLSVCPPPCMSGLWPRAFPDRSESMGESDDTGLSRLPLERFPVMLVVLDSVGSAFSRIDDQRLLPSL